MKILFITPGSGDNFYCENCMRDRDMVKALAKAGGDVSFMPLYLPVELELDINAGKAADGGALTKSPLFIGGVNAWLDQKLKCWRYMPSFIRSFFDGDFILSLAAKKAGMTNPAELGDMTLSMLQGRNGKQSLQLKQLIGWLIDPLNKPDAVILSDALLNGIASELVDKLSLPVFCMLQDEDGFLDSLGNYSSLCWQQVKDNSRYIRRYIAVSEFYADKMADRLGIKRDEIDVCYSGVDFSCYDDIVRSPKQGRVIGYLSRICRENGFDLLVDAFISLKQEDSFSDLRLIVSGGSIGDDDFIAEQKMIIDKAGLSDSVEFRDGFLELSDRKRFLSDISVMCVPVRSQPAHGRFVLESFAANVPVVVPSAGVFPEYLAKISGGLVYDNNSDLADVLKEHFSSETSKLSVSDIARDVFDINNNADYLYQLLREYV